MEKWPSAKGYEGDVIFAAIWTLRSGKTSPTITQSGDGWTKRGEIEACRRR